MYYSLMNMNGYSVETKKKEKLAKKLEGEENQNEKKPKRGDPLERKGEENPKGNN